MIYIKEKLNSEKIATRICRPVGNVWSVIDYQCCGNKVSGNDRRE